MISLTRFNGQRFAVNPDLIQRVEQTPDTVVTLIDGTKLLVREALEDVIAVVAEYRAATVARSIELAGTGELEVIAATRAATPPTALHTSAAARRRGHLRLQPEAD